MTLRKPHTAEIWNCGGTTGGSRVFPLPPTASHAVTILGERQHGLEAHHTQDEAVQPASVDVDTARFSAVFVSSLPPPLGLELHHKWYPDADWDDHVNLNAACLWCIFSTLPGVC